MSVSVNIAMEPELRARLTAATKEEGRTISGLLRWLGIKWLEQRELSMSYPVEKELPIGEIAALAAQLTGDDILEGKEDV